jgi:hypothetical protein
VFVSLDTNGRNGIDVRRCGNHSAVWAGPVVNMWQSHKILMAVACGGFCVARNQWNHDR